MAVKTPFSKIDFNKILSGYDLGELGRSKSFITGTVQTNFLLVTTKGKFVFRYYENRSKKSVQFESHLIEHLQQNNYPCPAQFENKNGEYVSIYKRKPFIIFEFIEGKHLENPSENQRKQLIEKVAELHHITKGFQPKNTNSRLNYNIENCRKLAQKETKRIGTANARAKLKWFESELLKLRLPQSLPKGICHCDFHFSNVLFKNNKFNALIDFDDANYTFLIFDLAALMNPFVSAFDWNTWSKFEIDENIFDFQEVRKTVAEYMKRRTLNRAEKDHLFDVFKLSIMFDCIWYYERGNAEDFFEKRKIEALDTLGRKEFYNRLFD